MLSKKYICFNGDYLPVNEPLICTKNRAFRYGDAIFETMFATGSCVMFFEEHFKRLQRGIEILKLEKDENFTREKISSYINRLFYRNRYFQGTKVRLTVFRKDGGTYNPTSNKLQYIIEMEPLENDKYTLNSKGLKTGIFEEVKKPLNIISTIKSANSLLFVLASLYQQDKGWDECLILNELGEICETTFSNIFIVKEGTVITPSLDSYCLSGIMRKQAINILTNLDYVVYEDGKLTINDIKNVDEIFLTNAMGIRWVQWFNNKPYINNVSKKVVAALNKMIQPENEKQPNS